MTYSITEKTSIILKKIKGYPARIIQGRMKNVMEKVNRYRNPIQEKKDEDRYKRNQRTGNGRITK